MTLFWQHPASERHSLVCVFSQCWQTCYNRWGSGTLLPSAHMRALGLCVCLCVSVTQYLTFHVFLRVYLCHKRYLPSRRRTKVENFLWKCFVAKLERFLLVWLRQVGHFLLHGKCTCVWIWTTWLAAILFLGETFIASSIIGHWR